MAKKSIQFNLTWNRCLALMACACIGDRFAAIIVVLLSLEIKYYD
jgi:hypothetical protein